MAWTTLCKLNDLVEGAGKYVETSRFQLAVFLSAGRVYVMDNYCPHAGGNLAGGRIEEQCAVCPWHDWRFRLHDGQLRESKFVHVRVYPARVEADTVEADLPQE